MNTLERAGAVLLFATIVSPQTAGPGGNAADPVYRVDVNLRQVDFIVTDAKGNHVSDLQASDFVVLEDGRPQPITNFSWVEVTPPPSGARLALLKEKPSLLERYTGSPRFRKTPDNDILSAPAANLRKDEIRRMIAIVAGDISAGAMARVRKFIDEQAGPGDMLSVRSVSRAVYPTGDSGRVQVRDSMGIFQQFTNDKRQLDAATERLPRGCGTRLCLTDAPGVLTGAIRSLQDLPGRKALLFVGRYKGPVEEIIRLANRAGVVIYVLDTLGVISEGETVADMVAPDSERLLAEKTGGRRLLSTVGFDFTSSLNEVIEDLSGYYLLGYHPADAGSDSAKNLVRHKIEVQVLRAGLTVRVRDGLMGAPDPAARPDQSPAAQPPGREETLKRALFSVYTQDGVRIHLEPLFAASTPSKKRKRSPLVRAALDIDGRDLALADADDGRKKTVVDVAVAVFNEDGSQAGAANKRFTLPLTKEQAAAVAKSSLQYKLDVALSKPGPYQVRAAVHDATSGEVGSAYAFLDIPDFNQPRISLSSLVLTPAEATPGVPARPDWNEFAPGATVQYLCEVFGLKTPGKPPAPPEVETQVKLYRGGGPVAEIPLAPVKIENIGEQSFLAGSLRIPENLDAGNYTMEVLAYDRLEASAKKQAAEQWIDVTVVRRQR